MFVNSKSDVDSNKMINQAALEAMYSGIYIEDYMDFIDNVPDDIQRNITQLRELDVRYQELLEDIDSYENALRNNPDDAASRKRTLLQIQRALIQTQDLGDKKLQIAQVIQDIIDNKVRQLEVDRLKLDDKKRNDYEKTSTSSKRGRLVNVTAEISRETEAQAETSKTEPPERPNKRARRQRHIDTPLRDDSAHEKDPPAPATTKTKKKKKRKAKAEKEHDNTPIDPPIDPNEPTYCLCDQVSFGEMIGCDNDGCEREWFHFSCVGLTTKPKGKWYCPTCRGDRSNQMRQKPI
ncbi:hypothetical protein JTE90_010188 [Oedothorax gibbosus]|uniref:Inhibitor of growth protein n=1 Tax=Oedothorax gibbosus TaxID=931172 RepID=A0AAV6UIX3_9ARAC|nr:hypothetical protein JTE90_010188 [Oedothorax gibbosus]